MNNILNDIKKNWMIVVPLISIILWYGANNIQVRANTEQIGKNTTSIISLSSQLVALQWNVYIICINQGSGDCIKPEVLK